MYTDMFKLDKNGFPAWATDFTKIYADFDPAKMSDQVMKAMKGQADAARVRELILERASQS